MSKSSLRLEKVTEDNVLEACRLQVAPEQRKFVSPVAQSLAEAYVHGDTAWPRVVMDGDELVGFVMAFFDVPFTEGCHHDRPRSGLWRLNIAADRQGRGYGRFAVEAVCEEIRRRGGTTATVTWVQARADRRSSTGSSVSTSRGDERGRGGRRTGPGLPAQAPVL